MAISNPFAFTPKAVTLITAIVYLGLAIPLIVLHETVPKAPSNPVKYHGLNTTEAWLDLTTLTNGYHPYNSRRNDDVRNWLLKRIEDILVSNGVSWNTESEEVALPSRYEDSNQALELLGTPTNGTDYIDELRPRIASHAVTVFNDLRSNVTFAINGNIAATRAPGISSYFEGTNIIVYIRGTEDEDGEWWKSDHYQSVRAHGKGGVLVNAHYDSVSTGYGATDDGIGVVTVLQMIRFFSTPGNQPKKGVVALLNNGEEDFLNGAKAYTQHPISKFAYTFVNLEGAGAGGRAVLFRSTDTEVTRAYATSPHPFGTVVGGDGFKFGFIRSQTDYVIFTEDLGLRGLDVAFWYPRARYHTEQDDTKHTSVDSLWHMLSTAVSTMKALTSDTSSAFSGPRGDGAKGKVKNGKGTDAVWFDIFGKGFALFRLRGLFAWSLTLLIVSPLTLLVVTYLLIREGKFYYFSASVPFEGGDIEAESLPLYGWRGFFRFPVALIAASGLTIGSAYLVAKSNPLIIYSSHYTVWSMMLILYFTVFWFIMRGADFVRPSALHRGYAYLWIFVIGWALLVAATVLEDRFKIAAGYVVVFFESAAFLAALISLLELFALPSKQDFAHQAHGEQETRDGIDALPDSEALIAPDADEEVEEEPTEQTPLFGGSSNGSRPATTFANYARRSLGAETDGGNDHIEKEHKPYGLEQDWSEKLPSWTWLIQFLIVAPFPFIIIGQIGLLVVEAVAQTGSEGSSLLAPFQMMACFTIFLLLPVAPAVHRFTYHVPTFLFHIFIGTLIYNLVAFPFSATNRYKAYFVQHVNLETGQNNVTISGLEEYVRPIIATIPSAAGQAVECDFRGSVRAGVSSCSWSGIAPRVVRNTPEGVPPEKRYAEWLHYNVTRVPGRNAAQFIVEATNTRAAVLRFSRPIKDFRVKGSSRDDRFEAIPEFGSNMIKLWHREWDQPWIVDVEWPVGEGKQQGDEGMEGTVVGIWSDVDTKDTIPAFDEIKRYAPDWVAISKASDGLVEGSKPFIV